MPVQGLREKDVYRREDELEPPSPDASCFQFDAATMTIHSGKGSECRMTLLSFKRGE